MSSLNIDDLEDELKKKRICRFCLSPWKITNIFTRDTRIKSSAPLRIQIMAIASIEVFSNDGMPPFVCNDCTNMFEYCYQFKQMCKKADNLLRQFPLTGKLPQCLEKPTLQANHLGFRPEHATKTSTEQESMLLSKKILNSSVTANSPEAATFINVDTSIEVKRDPDLITSTGKPDEEFSITFLDKIENNDALSLDDIHQLVDAEDVNETESIKVEKLPLLAIDSGIKSAKPKLLKKSHIKILNKEAQPEKEPCLSVPKMKKAEDGKMEIVVDEDYVEEPDPKNAVPVETNIFSCHHCERTFPLLQLRDIHMQSHTRDRKFECDECDKSFCSKYDLFRHKFVHNAVKPFKCSVCGKGFARKHLLTRHERTHADVPKHICVHCERSYLSKDDMEKHAKKHAIYRPFVCKICQKGFVFKQGLERHEVIHSSQQPYPCHYCDKSFSTTTKLFRHLTAHAGLRPFPCKYCKNSYLLPHHLRRHLRSHKNVNDPVNTISFMCMRCNTSFDSRDGLIKHSTTHANEKNLACPLCKDVFSNMLELTSHIQDHSDGEAYACEFCDLIFITSEKLQVHTDLDHLQEMEAYHADDRAQADKKREKEEADEFLNKILVESKGNADEILLEKQIKKETTDNNSPRIVNQIIIKNATDHSLLIPLKQRKVEVDDKNVTANQTTSKQVKQGPQLRRKTPNVTGDSKQPTIQQHLLKRGDVTKSPPSKTSPSEKIVPMPKIKTEKESPTTTSLSSANDDITKTEVIAKKVKKITLTKEQAAAMAKDGRIKIKDGKIILKKEKGQGSSPEGL